MSDYMKNADVHDMPDERLVEEHDYFLQITAHGDPDSVSQDDLRRFKRVQMEVVNRLAHKNLTNGSTDNIKSDTMEK